MSREKGLGEFEELFNTQLPAGNRDVLVQKAKKAAEEEKSDVGNGEKTDELSSMTFAELVKYYRIHKEEYGMRKLTKGQLEKTDFNAGAIREIIRKAQTKKIEEERKREADDIDLLIDYDDCNEYIEEKGLIDYIEDIRSNSYGIYVDTLDEIKKKIRKAEKEKNEKEQTSGTPEYIDRMLREKKWGKGQFEYNRSKDAWVFSDSDGKKYVVESREDEQPVEGLDYLFSKKFHTSGEYKGKPITLDRDVFLVSLRKPYPDGHKTRQEIEEEEDRIKYEKRESLVFGTEEYAQEFVEDGMWKKGKFRQEGDEWVMELYIDSIKTKYIVEAGDTQPYTDVEYYFAPSAKHVVSEGNGKDKKFKSFNPLDEKNDGGRVIERTYYVNLMPPYPEEHTEKAKAEAAEEERKRKEKTYGTEEFAQKKEREKEVDKSVQDEGINENLERDGMTPVEEIRNLLENTTFNGANKRIKKGVLLRISTQLSNREYDKAIDIMRKFFDVTSEIEEKTEELRTNNPEIDTPAAQEGVAVTYGSEGGKDISSLEKQRNIVRRQIESFAGVLNLEKNVGVIRNTLLALNTDYPSTALRILNKYRLKLDGSQKEKFDNGFREVEKQLRQFSSLKDIQPEEDHLDLEEKTIVKLGIQANRLIREFVEDCDEKEELKDEIGNFGLRTKFEKIEDVKKIFDDIRDKQDPDKKDEAFRDIDKILNKIIEKQKRREGEL